MNKKFIELKKVEGGVFTVRIDSIYMLRSKEAGALTDVYIAGFAANGYNYITAKISYDELKRLIGAE